MNRRLTLLLGLMTIVIAAVILLLLRAPDRTPQREAAAPKPGATAPATPSPAGAVQPVDLAAVFDLRGLPNCEPGAGLDSVLERMVKTNPVTFEASRGDPISVPGHDRPLVPTFERRHEVAENVDIRAVTSDLDLTGRLHGLEVVGLRRSFYEESDSASWEIRFANDPARVREALNRAGFRLPAIGEWVDVGGEGLSVSMAVEAVDGGGAALVCAQG